MSKRMWCGALVALAASCQREVKETDAGEPPPPVLPRLTQAQYRNTLVDVFGPALPVVPLPSDTNPYLFYSIGAASTALSELGAQQYADAADALSQWLTAEPVRSEAVLGCAPASVDDPCVAQIVTSVGLRLYRRPLTTDEVARWTAVVADTARGDARRGLRLALFGMLQSPHFLYRSELGEPDPEAPQRNRYTSYEMAGRLSFLLWDSAPDLELLEAAGRGELVTEAGIHAQAVRLLESPRARAAVQAFFTQYLDLSRLDGLERDPTKYPAFTPTIAESMKNEIRLLVDHYVFRENSDIRGLFSSRTTFVNRELADLYDVEAPGASEIAFVRVELPSDGPRAGILTSGAFLAVNAHQTETSPTLRGKYVRERVLCAEVPPPPDDVDLQIPPPDGQANTLRERLERHRSSEICASCHAVLDPPGFLFENFDAIGAARDNDRGFPLDTSGDLEGIPLAGARDLAAVLEHEPRVGNCIVKQLYRHASARLDTKAERGVLVSLQNQFAASGYRFQELLLELAVSRGFRTIAAPEVSP
jgi:hypothetical protein